MVRNPIVAPLWLAAVIIAAAVFVGGATGSMINRTGGPVFTVAGSTALNGSFNGTFAPVVESASPAVVNIFTTRVVSAEERELGDFLDDPLFRHFFGDDFMPEHGIPSPRERNLGSGVIVSPEGYILTNFHVVRDAADIQVALFDNRQLQARIAGTDPKTDLALLKVDANGLDVLPLADSSRVYVGDIALAIGNPFGIGSTVTMGIISATGRGGLGMEAYEDYLQTDAAINPGNSGGALINVHGELIGINTAILSPTGANLGIGFAVPSNMARFVMEQLATHGKVIRGWLGVVIGPLTPEITAQHNLDVPRGAHVSTVAPRSPADTAGLRAGDIIFEVNGQTIEGPRQLQLLIGQNLPGETLNFRVLRKGQEMSVAARLAEEPVSRQ